LLLWQFLLLFLQHQSLPIIATNNKNTKRCLDRIILLQVVVAEQRHKLVADATVLVVMVDADVIVTIVTVTNNWKVVGAYGTLLHALLSCQDDGWRQVPWMKYYYVFLY
jgi:hypothetical protein